MNDKFASGEKVVTKSDWRATRGLPSNARVLTVIDQTEDDLVLIRDQDHNEMSFPESELISLSGVFIQVLAGSDFGFGFSDLETARKFKIKAEEILEALYSATGEWEGFSGSSGHFTVNRYSNDFDSQVIDSK